MNDIYKTLDAIDRIIFEIQAKLEEDIPDKEAVNIALDDLISAKAHLMLGLVSDEVRH